MIERHSKGTLLQIWVKTRAKKRSIQISNDSMYCEVKVKAEPTRGKANREVIELIATHLGISTEKVRLVIGVKSPKKVLLIEEMEPVDVLALLRRQSTD